MVGMHMRFQRRQQPQAQFAQQRAVTAACSNTGSISSAWPPSANRQV